MKIINEAINIDGIDKIILRELMEDARKPILEIARKVGISGAAIHQRLRKLESSGLISGSRLILDAKILGYTTTAFVGIYLDRAMSNPRAVKQLEEIPEVLECHYTTGNWSVLLKYCAKTMSTSCTCLIKIQAIEGVSRTETFISLNQQIERQIQV